MEQSIETGKTVIKLFEDKFILDKNKQTFSRFEIAEFLRSKKDYEEEMVKMIFEDAKYFAENNISIGPSTYYHKKFGDKNNLVLPDIDTVVIATYTYKNDNDRYATRKTFKKIGVFKNLSDKNKQNYRLKSNFILKTKGNLIEFSDVIEWSYVDKDLLFAFFDTIKSNRIIPIENKTLVKRFINIYRKYVDLGICVNGQTRYTTNYLSSKKDTFSLNLNIIELLEKSCKVYNSEKTDYHTKKDIPKFIINAKGELSESYSIGFKDIYNSISNKESHSLFGINISQRDIDKISLADLVLTLDEVKKLENIYQQTIDISVTEENSFNYLKCDFEFKQNPIEIMYHCQLDFFKDNEFKAENKYYFLSKKGYYKHKVKISDVEFFLKHNKDNIKEYCIKNDIDGFLFYSNGNNGTEYQKYYYKTNKIEVVEHSYFWNHGKEDHRIPYLRLFDESATYNHNKIKGFFIELKEIGDNQDLYNMLSHYHFRKNPFNFEMNFIIDEIPVILVGDVYFHICRFDFEKCYIIDETFNLFESEKKLPIDFLYNEIIKNNGSFIITKMAIKYPMKNYLISNI